MSAPRRQSPFPFYEGAYVPTARAAYVSSSFSEDMSTDYAHTPTPSVAEHLPMDRRLTPARTWAHGHSPEYDVASDASPMYSPYFSHSHSPSLPQHQGSFPGVVGETVHLHPALAAFRMNDSSPQPMMRASPQPMLRPSPAASPALMQRRQPRLSKNRRSVPYIEQHTVLVDARRVVPSFSQPQPRHRLARMVAPVQPCTSAPDYGEYGSEEPIRSHMLDPGPRRPKRSTTTSTRADSTANAARTMMFESRKNSLGARHNGGVKKIALADLNTAKNARHIYPAVKKDIDQSNTYHAVFTCYHLSHPCDACLRVSYEDRGHKKTLYYLSHGAVLQELFPVPSNGWLPVRCARLAALQMKNLLTIAYGRNADWHVGNLVPLFALFCALRVHPKFVDALRMRIVEVGAQGEHVALFMRQARETGMKVIEGMFSETLEWTEQKETSESPHGGTAPPLEEEKGPGSMCAECCQWRPKMCYSKVQWNRRIRDVRRCKECCERKKAWEANPRS